MPIEPLSWLLLSILGGWIAADGTSVGQIMVSRPLVAATLAGWLAGSPTAGAAAGVVLEVFSLTVLPVGAARYPEGGPAAVVVGATFALSDQRASTLLTGLVFFLVWQAFGGATIRWMRQANSRLLRAGGEGIATESQLERRHLAAVGLDWARGIALVATGIPLLHVLLEATRRFGEPLEPVAGLTLHVALVALIASAARLFGRRGRFLLAGAATGALVLLLRG